jgi:hypothetical protein
VCVCEVCVCMCVCVHTKQMEMELEMEAASAGPHPPSEEETVSKNLFEAKLKEYLVAAGPKSKLMSKARYDQTIQTIETEKGQFVGSVSRAYQIRKEYDVINIKDRKILYKRSSNAEFDGRAPVDDLCRVAHEEEVYELLRLHHDELTLHGSARRSVVCIKSCARIVKGANDPTTTRPHTYKWMLHIVELSPRRVWIPRRI